jgi:hypothetical protein
MNFLLQVPAQISVGLIASRQSIKSRTEGGDRLQILSVLLPGPDPQRAVSRSC